MRVSISERNPQAINADAFVALFRVPRRGRPELPLAEYLREDAARLVGRRVEGTTWLETRGLSTPRILLACLGTARLWDPELEYLGGHAGSFDRASEALNLRRTLRNTGAIIERACNLAGIRHAALIAWPEDCDPSLIIEGMVLRAHDPRAWEQSNDGPVASSLRRVSVSVTERPKSERRAIAASVRERVEIAAATNFARELGDLPSNVGTATEIVARVQARLDASTLPLSLSTIPAADATALGMGLFTAVDAGASERGCILRLDYRGRSGPDHPDSPLVLVGKGLTHDTGGYNLKSGAVIHQLTHDKCGATAVIGAMIAIAALELPLDIIALCPLTENTIDAHAYKPGDVLTACNGTTVYVENTDAEGRLVLADVLAWLQTRDPRPELVIDLATLTGTIHSALGEPFAGLFCNEDRARELLVAAGKASGDLVWPMPIHDIHERELGHHKADIRNVGASSGSPCSAAAFLRSFVDYPWAHVDLAGKAHAEFARDYYGPGATGFGCRLLVELARALAEPRI